MNMYLYIQPIVTEKLEDGYYQTDFQSIVRAGFVVKDDERIVLSEVYKIQANTKYLEKISDFTKKKYNIDGSFVRDALPFENFMTNLDHTIKTYNIDKVYLYNAIVILNNIRYICDRKNIEFDFSKFVNSDVRLGKLDFNNVAEVLRALIIDK